MGGRRKAPSPWLGAFWLPGHALNLVEVHMENKKKILLYGLGILIIVILLIFGFVIKNSSSPSSNTNGTSQTTATTSVPNKVSFYATSIEQLVNYLDTNSGQNPTEAVPGGLAEIKGKVLQKELFSYSGSKSYYIKIGDDNDYIALLMLEPTYLNFPELYSKINVGENVIARGASGSMECSADTSKNDVGTKLCNSLGITQVEVPILVAIEPMPELNNLQPIEDDISSTTTAN